MSKAVSEMPARGCVLVADDEPAVVELLRDALQAEGFRVVCAADGPAALRRAREHHPDLVVLDVGLPGLDGFEVCRASKGKCIARRDRLGPWRRDRSRGGTRA